MTDKNTTPAAAANTDPKKSKDVSITKAKGRPMLTWVGKKPLARVKAFAAQAIERFDATAGQALPTGAADWRDWPQDLPHGGLLYHGDNKDVLAHLLTSGFRGKVKLIYIDPPFDSGADYVRKVQLRGAKGTVKIDGEDYTLGEQVQYSDIWANDNYLQFMYERLLMLRELLDETGAIAVHCDYTKGHYLRLILDEIFGAKNFVNDITWYYENKPQFGFMKHLPHDHDLIFVYSKNYGDHCLNHQQVPVKEVQQQAVVAWDPVQKKRVAKRDESGNIVYETREEKYMGSVWTIPLVHPIASERTGYPTQKPEPLLERVVRVFSMEGDLVLDCFIGSGTTAAVAQSLGRRWIGCDINKGAIQTTAKRLQELMRSQAAAAAKPKQGELVGAEDTPTQAAQYSFATYRVNDYDLQIQHNEAVELACQHLGVTRTRADAFFDGTQGGRLVKIIPFNHPLTPLDLEAIKTELKNRPSEERDVMVVCLGWEHSARAAVEDYNRNRPINKLHVVELRTDRKLGGIIQHEPLTAQVSARREGEKLVVEIADVVSPSIMQRLNREQGVLRAQITDWRAVVDCILIDTQYDGEVFKVTLSDLPERKQDLVDGRYELPAPPSGATVAIKIIDMLGEELIYLATP